MSFEEIARIFKKPTEEELELYSLKKRIILLMEDISDRKKLQTYEWFQVYNMLNKLLKED